MFLFMGLKIFPKSSNSQSDKLFSPSGLCQELWLGWFPKTVSGSSTIRKAICLVMIGNSPCCLKIAVQVLMLRPSEGGDLLLFSRKVGSPSRRNRPYRDSLSEKGLARGVVWGFGVEYIGYLSWV